MTRNDDAPDFDALVESLEQIDGLDVSRDVPAGSLCTYRVGGPLGALVRVDDRSAVPELCAALSRSEVAVITIGKGSNLLVSDRGFDGVAVLLGEAFAQIDIDRGDDAVTARVVAGAAAALPVVARATVAAGLTGFEWAVGVPGSIGGAVRMNAGGHGSDMAASLVSVDVADVALGGVVTLSADALDLGYRRSNIAPWQIVLDATLELGIASPEALVDGAETEASDPLREIVAWRREHQPGGANAGSVFTNPDGDSAGRLIDSVGLKGMRVGTAEVSTKHANFIQSDADGSADDIASLMVAIVDRVLAETGVRLHAETRLVGFPSELVDHVQPGGRREGDLSDG